MLLIFVKCAILFITIKGVFGADASAELRRCIIPNMPELQNMKFSSLLQNQSLELGSFIEDYGVIHIECKSKHILKGPSYLICKHGEWDNKFPACEAYCDATSWKGLSLKAICEKNTNFFKCPERIEPGTNVNMVCAFSYVRTPNTPQILKCQSNGSFDKTPIPCKQDCGRILTFSKTLTKAGNIIEMSTHPWHVSIYKNLCYKSDFVCSGSIISPRIIITAAHCFGNMEPLNREKDMKYQIIAGQSRKAFTSVNNEHAVLVTVEEINIPIAYAGIKQHLKHDIAFLKLTTPLKYSETIAPICISDAFLTEVPAHVIASHKVGYVNAFGLTNDLKRHKMEMLTREDCAAKLPHYAVVTDDKFCIHNNESSSLCAGDSGVGYYTDYLDPNTNKNTYRLLGVVSNSLARMDSCMDDKSYAAITSILQIPADFKLKLANAINEDEALF